MLNAGRRILIAAPLEYELAPLREKLDQESFAVQPTFLTLGVGPNKSVKTLEKFLGADPEWDLVLIAGLAGALADDLRTGDVVTPSLIEEGPARTDISSDGVSGGAKRVPFLTVNRILKPSEKQKALEEHPEAQVVDMESFGLAGLCLRKRISFKIFRSILDEKDYIFPDFRWVFSQGKLGDVVPFLFYCLRHPRKAAQVLDLKKKVRGSLARLTAFMVTYLENKTYNT